MLESISNSILNGLTFAEYIGFLFYILIGVLISYFGEQVKYAAPIQRSGGFKIATWIQENWKRLVLTVLCIHVVAVFMEQIVGQSSNWQALIIGGSLGYTVDGIIDTFAKKKK